MGKPSKKTYFLKSQKWVSPQKRPIILKEPKMGKPPKNTYYFKRAKNG